MLHSLPTEITAGLKAVLRRIRRLQMSRGALGIICITLASVLLIMAMDYFFAPLSVQIRWLLFGILVVTILASIWKLLLKPISRRIELVHIARWLEIKHPEIQERISSAIELSDNHASGASESLLEELITEARVDIVSIQPKLEVNFKRTKAWIWPAISLTSIFVLLFVLWPAQTGRLFIRALAPFSSVGNAGAFAFNILPGDQEVIAGGPVKIRILYQGSSSDSLILETIKSSGETTEERLLIDGQDAGQWIATYHLPHARESFRYRIRAGRGESDTYQVTVWPKPQFSTLEANYNYPTYTGWAAATRDLDTTPGSRGVKAIAGTQVQLDGKLNTPIESGSLSINDKLIGPLTIESVAAGGKINIEFPMHLEQSGRGIITLKHRLGNTIEAVKFPVKVIPDKAPTVRLLSPSKLELKIKSNDQLPISYEVIEEVGLQSVELAIELDGKPQAPIQQQLPTRGKLRKKSSWSGQLLVHISDLIEQHPKTRKIKLKLRIKDNRPKELNGPGIGESKTIVLKISPSAESLTRQKLRNQESDILETTEKAKQKIQQAMQKMDRHRENIKKEEVSKETQQDLAEARKSLSEAEKQLKELAKRMEDSVHAPKAEQVKTAAEQSKKSREQLETTPLQDKPVDRAKELQQARKAAENTVKKLDKFRQDMDRDRQKVEDLARLQDLAQKEETLARQAEKQAKMANGNPTKKVQHQAKQQDEAWKRAQRDVQEELRRAVEKRPEAVAKTTQQQAKEARDLAKKARDMSQQQQDLEKIARQAQAKKQKNNKDTTTQSAGQKELKKAIQKQLEKEQEKLNEQIHEQLAQVQKKQNTASDPERQNQLNEQANRLPEAIDKAQQALAEMRKDDPENAAMAAKDTAKTLNELAENKSSEPSKSPALDPEIKKLAERQEKLAGSMESLSQGETDKAAQALQDLQAEAAQELADNVNKTPQIHGKSSNRQRAESSARSADDHAREAAKQNMENNPEAAADRNAHAAKALEQTAIALEAHAKQLEQIAKQAQQQAEKPPHQQPKNQAPVDAQQLADAFEKAAEAANAQDPQSAAEASREAADALSQLAEQTKQNMQAGREPGTLTQDPMNQQADANKPNQNQPQQPNQPGKPGQQPSGKPDDQKIPPQPDPGVPPELAKLGVSASDWEKLKVMLRSDVGGAEGTHIPEDYRLLVRQYFEQMANEGKEKR